MKMPSWPTVIVAFITAVFLAVVAFIFFTRGHQVELVTPDYYAQEINYQAHIDAVQRARQFPADSVLQVRDGQAHIAIPNFQNATGTLHLYRASDARLDQHLPLALDAEGRQVVDLGSLAPGPWRFNLMWTVSNENYLVELQPVL